MKRRVFVLSTGAAVLVGTRLSRAAQGGRVRRLKILSEAPRNDPQSELLLAVLSERFRQSGWLSGHDLDIEFCSVDVDTARAGRQTPQNGPEAFLAVGAAALSAARRATRTVPIIFTLLDEPVDLAAWADLDWPGTNLAGVADFESASFKRWIELLTACAPSLQRIALVSSRRAAVHRVVPSRLPVIPIEGSSIPAITGAIEGLAGQRDAGVAILPNGFDAAHLEAITAVAAHCQLPTISFAPRFARRGGLLSYGPNIAEIYQRVALYIDLVLRGTKPSQLEIGRPIAFDLVVNLRTAKVLGLHVPPSVIRCANEIIA